MTPPPNDFATRLESLTASIDAEPYALKRFALIQQRDALLANHAPAIAKVVKTGQQYVSDDDYPSRRAFIDALAELNAEAKP